MSSYSRRRSRSPYQRGGRSVVSRSSSRSRSRSRSEDLSDVENPGNNLYVTGLSPRITKKELEKHFSSEGKVVDIHLVVDPRTRESRGFGFVTMSNLDEAECCLKYLDRSVLAGRVITVEKARRRRGRTPTPGRYLGLKAIHVRRRSPRYSPYERSRSPRYSERDRERSYSPYSGRRKSARSRSLYSRSPVARRNMSCSRYSDDRSVSPYFRSRSPRYSERDRERSYSPYSGRRKSARSRSLYSRSPVARRNMSCSRYSDDRSVSPYFRRHDRFVPPYYRRHDRSISPYYRRHDRSVSPYYRKYDRSVSPYYESHSRYRSISPSVSPRGRRSSKRSYSRSFSPRSRRSSRRSLSHSVSPMARVSSRRSYSRSPSPTPSPRLRRSHGRRSRSYSRSVSSCSRSVSRSRSPTPVSPSPSPSR